MTCRRPDLGELIQINNAEEFDDVTVRMQKVKKYIKYFATPTLALTQALQSTYMSSTKLLLTAVEHIKSTITLPNGR